MSKKVSLLKSRFAKTTRSGVLILIVPILLAAHGAQAAYPDYVLACESLMENLKQRSVHIPPYEGRPTLLADIFTGKALERWIKRNGGQLRQMDSGGSNTKIFRWTSPTGESRIIKAYFNIYEALHSDRQFKFLDHNLPVGLLQVVPRTGKYRSLRFYKDVHGVTLAHLIKEKFYPEEINQEIRRLYVEHLNAFKARVVDRYGEKRVHEVEEAWDTTMPDLHLEVTTSPGHNLRIWIHDENVLFDSTTKEFFIIDLE